MVEKRNNNKKKEVACVITGYAPMHQDTPMQ